MTTIFFGPMKKMLGGQKFASDMVVLSSVCQWLGEKPALLFAEGIQKLVYNTQISV